MRATEIFIKSKFISKRQPIFVIGAKSFKQLHTAGFKNILHCAKDSNAIINFIKNIYFLCSDYCVGSLTPKRMTKLNEEGVFITKKTTISVKKWKGRYYLVHFSRTYNPSFDYYLNIY